VAENVPVIVLAFAVAGLGVAVFSGTWQVRPILSGSMRPQLPVGGVVITERQPSVTLQTGDIIVFHPPGDPQQLVVHRVIWMEPTSGGLLIKTKGDANGFIDPWSPFVLKGPYIYRVQATIPYLGYAGVAVHSRVGQLAGFGGGVILVLIAAFYLLLPSRGRRHRLAP